MPTHLLNLIVAAGVVVLSVASIAGGAVLPTELIDCRALTSSVARLDCYDQLVDARTASPNQASEQPAAEDAVLVAPAAATATAESEPDLSQENLFGQDESAIRKSVQDATGAEEIDRIEARITDLGKSRSGKVVITLDNGQVWIQTGSKRAHLSANDEVTIRRRSFGSYMLSNKKTAIRVKHIS